MSVSRVSSSEAFICDLVERARRYATSRRADGTHVSTILPFLTVEIPFSSKRRSAPLAMDLEFLP